MLIDHLLGAENYPLTLTVVMPLYSNHWFNPDFPTRLSARKG